MSENVREKVEKYPIIELVIVSLTISFLILAWLMYEEPCPQDMEFYLKNEERNLATSAVKDTITSSLTATSIILAATALVVSLSKNAAIMDATVKTHYKYVAGYTLLSIIVGAFNMAYMPSLINAHNVAFYPQIHILSAIQFIFMVCAAGRLLSAILKSL